MIQGIDVSDWQGAVDWTAHAESEVGFAFARATEGDGVVDARFAENWAAMGRSGLVRGAYHVARPHGEPLAQARHFLDTVRLAPGDLAALEFKDGDELPAGEVAAFGRKWCAEVTRRSGLRPLVWTHLHFAADGYCEGLEAYPLWITAPGRPMGRPEVPAPWRAWTIHQYASSPVDLDVFAGSLPELLALGAPDKRAK
ncbi:glycoside hydrolase family 25 protein [Acrocarpospora catenulata]|uniref:glycoside hydrolase family 25 protein n=1 Tax=Acrocarpospora catenulata TaxID=2836182 RepID=UPI001BDB3FB5|nr:glycoside hydrolase family 25 protein [Acrocarpospora catenulata]